MIKQFRNFLFDNHVVGLCKINSREPRVKLMVALNYFRRRHEETIFHHDYNYSATIIINIADVVCTVLNNHVPMYIGIAV